MNNLEYIDDIYIYHIETENDSKNNIIGVNCKAKVELTPNGKEKLETKHNFQKFQIYSTNVNKTWNTNSVIKDKLKDIVIGEFLNTYKNKNLDKDTLDLLYKECMLAITVDWFNTRTRYYNNVFLFFLIIYYLSRINI